MRKLNILFFIACVCLLSSCSLEKRHYRPGFYHGQRDHFEYNPETSSAIQPVNTETNFIREQDTAALSRNTLCSSDTQQAIRQTIIKSPGRQKILPAGHPFIKPRNHPATKIPDPDDGERPRSKNWTKIGLVLSILGIIISIAVALAAFDFAILLFVLLFILLTIIFGTLAVVTRGDAKEKAEAENAAASGNADAVKHRHKRSVALGVLIWGIIFFMLGILSYLIPGLVLLAAAGILPLLIVGIIQLVKNKKAGDKHKTRQTIFGMLFGLIGVGLGILLTTLAVT